MSQLTRQQVRGLALLLVAVLLLLLWRLLSLPS
jgi:hypothetical protein